ncbi:helix-turn-helix domain-containing protein [Paraburkholderia dilworthii]|uniref:Helix-turn-helix domain-containing protein n=1 Tax=Paraburkholderia dilworthii TaxID=948106 RepID=A0ABW9D5C2_9BURK
MTPVPATERTPHGDSLTLRQFADRFNVSLATAVKWLDGDARLDPAWAESFVPPPGRDRSVIEAMGLLTCSQAATFVGRSVPTVNVAARAGELPFVLVNGVRAFDRADLTTWLAAKNTPPAGPLLSNADAWRLLGYANRASITNLVKSGRLPVVLDKQGNKRVKRSDVEALAAEREAKKAKREARA